MKKTFKTLSDEDLYLLCEILVDAGSEISSMVVQGFYMRRKDFKKLPKDLRKKMYLIDDLLEGENYNS